MYGEYLIQQLCYRCAWNLNFLMSYQRPWSKFWWTTEKVLNIRVLLSPKVLQHVFIVHIFKNALFQKQLYVSIVCLSLNIYKTEYASLPINFTRLQCLQENANCSNIHSGFIYITHFNFRVQFSATIYLLHIYFFSCWSWKCMRSY